MKSISDDAGFLHDDFKRIGSDDDQDRAEERARFASANTWEARARHFIELTNKYLRENDRSRRKPQYRAGIQTV